MRLQGLLLPIKDDLLMLRAKPSIGALTEASQGKPRLISSVPLGGTMLIEHSSIYHFAIIGCCVRFEPLQKE